LWLFLTWSIQGDRRLPSTVVLLPISLYASFYSTSMATLLPISMSASFYSTSTSGKRAQGFRLAARRTDVLTSSLRGHASPQRCSYGKSVTSQEQ
jgi:hypothetical protein